jgi:exo-beta-1,3-glucanase (GH17 family)
MRKSVNLFILTVAAVALAWWWLGAPVSMPPSPLGSGQKLFCVSYAPFRGSQTPLDPTTRIPPVQIDEDLAQLARLTDCVRTYSVHLGLDYVPQAARKHGLKVMLGLWLSSHPDRNELQITRGIELAKEFPDVIRAVIVGNEALLRGEISPATLAETLHRVKAQVDKPVTYADVWEFWLRHRDLSSAVDFITIHILPYWEDDPIPAERAADHVASIRARAASEFPGKEIVIGETGWPSAGRMREGALPSPANQARVLHDILGRAKRDNFQVNLIEAYDQPWKRYLEGTVGGHWGLLDDRTRAAKFAWGEPVSDHPDWPWQAAGGVALATLVFAIGLRTRRRNMPPTPCGLCSLSAVALIALTSGVLVGWVAENALLESFGIGGKLRSLALLTTTIASPLLCAAALAVNAALPSFDRVLAAREDRERDPLLLALGLAQILACVLAVQTALVLVFDPRYRDFAFAPLTAAAVPFLLLRLAGPRATGPRAPAESVAAVILVLCAVYILVNETIANWQALWLCAALVALAVSLARARVAPGKE